MYIAGEYEDRERVKATINLLESLGHEITFDWTPYEDDCLPEKGEWLARHSIESVKRADAYIGLYLDDYKYRGALVEMGTALGFKKPCYLIGDSWVKDCLFMSHPLVRKFDRIVDFLAFLDGG